MSGHGGFRLVARMAPVDRKGSESLTSSCVAKGGGRSRLRQLELFRHGQGLGPEEGRHRDDAEKGPMLIDQRIIVLEGLARPGEGLLK